MITPGLGLIFWMTVTFALFLFVLGKFAWKPIVKAIDDRDESIKTALEQAQLAREEMQKLKAENEIIMKEAKLERDAILKEAKDIKDRMIDEARDLAKEEGEKMIAMARYTIENEKNAAMAEIKSHIAMLSIDVAEKILHKELDQNSPAHDKLVEEMLNNSNFN